MYSQPPSPYSPHEISQKAYRPSVRGRNGAVASGHYLASQAGLQIMMAGGNAIDAAIATAAALGVVEPQSSGVGGDGFILIYDAKTRDVYAVNATGAAPTGATREFYLKRDGIPMKGILSVSIPGLVDGWLVAHERFGTRPLHEVFAPAIGLCEDGFPLSHKLAGSLKAQTKRFASDPYTRAVFTDDGQPLAPGDIVYQKDLGKTLRTLAAQGRDAFYEGEIAKAMVAFSQSRGGLLTEADLKNHRAHIADPIAVTYKGHTVYETPPNSSGHILLQELNIVENFDLHAMSKAERIHLMVEAKKLAFADREKYVADPDWIDIPIDGLLSKVYAKERAALIDPDRAAVHVPPGIPEAVEDTTCFCVADKAGNAVCQLQSIQSGWGSSLIAGETGILLNNRMTYWHLEADHPNCLMPGKRVRHTMNPVIVTKDDKPVLICGTPGADTQVQTNLQLVTHILDFGLTPQEAVEAPRWRSLQNPMESTVPHTCEDVLQLEARFDTFLHMDLEKKGHDVFSLPLWGATGNAQAIQIDPATGSLMAGSDPRHDGYAVAF